MTKIPKDTEELKSDTDSKSVVSVSNRKNNYKSQKPILEKKRRDRINQSLDELKSLLLAIKQRDPLRYARLEKADILEMVVKHLKDVKKKRQAMIASMEPVLFRSFKMGYLDCTRETIGFINDLDTVQEKKQQIIDHVTAECLKNFQSQVPPQVLLDHQEAMFADYSPPMNDQFMPFSMLNVSAPLPLESDREWPSLEERLGFSPIGKSRMIQSDTLSTMNTHLNMSFVSPISSGIRSSAFNIVKNGNSFESASTSGISGMSDDTPKKILFDDPQEISDDDDDDVKLIIDDPNNNPNAWRPWL
ncbi:unnamed protein product [Diamesa serratosioi]